LECFGPGQAGGALYGEAQNRMLSRARIAVNVHQYFGEHPADRYGAGANQRFFELAGIGVAQLCDRKTDLPQHFVDGEEIVFYGSASELKERARALLAEQGRASRIGAAGRRRAIAEHTWEQRVRELLMRSL
jgi:spore maturation protein CgeB